MALLGFFSFKVFILVGFVILAIFAIFVSDFLTKFLLNYFFCDNCEKKLLANRLGTGHVFIRIKMVLFQYALIFCDQLPPIKLLSIFRGGGVI